LLLKEKTTMYKLKSSVITLFGLHHYDALFARAARSNPPPNLPPILSSHGLVVERRFVTKEERPALLAYLLKL